MRLARNLSFHFLWSSTFASGLADRLAMLSIAVMLGQGLTDQDIEAVRLADASIIAGINFWFFLGYVVWGPFAGWLADRWSRKWLMFIADESRGVLILLALLMLPAGAAGYVPGLYEPWFECPVAGWAVGLDHAWKIWLMMFAIGLFAATFSPSRNSVIPNVVGYPVLQRANAIVLGLGVIGNLFGFLIGGPLAEQAVRLCVMVSAGCFLASGWMWPFLKTPAMRHDRPTGRSSPRRGDTSVNPLAATRQILQGGRYILQHRPLLILTIANVIFWSGAHLILAAGSAISVDLYGGSIEQFGYIGGAFGAGMLLGSLILGLINARYGGEVIMTISLVGAAILLSLLASVPNLYLGLAIALALGFFGGLIMISINTMIQQFTADGFRGRVMGFRDLASVLGGVTVSLVIWRMADADRYTLWAAHAFAAILLIGAAYGLWRFVMAGPAERRPWWNAAWRLTRFVAIALHQRQVSGGHHVPRRGGALIVANHQAGLDPVLIQVSIPRPVRYLMGTENMIAALGWLWRLIQPIPVHRTGRDSAAVRQAVEALQGGALVGIFPEGGFGEGGRAGMKQFNRGVAMIARRSGKPIVPVWVDGPEAGAVWRALFVPSRSRVVFGPAFTIEQLENQLRDDQEQISPRQLDEQVTEQIRQRLTDLAPDPGK